MPKIFTKRIYVISNATQAPSTCPPSSTDPDLTLTDLGSFDVDDQLLTINPFTPDVYGAIDTNDSTRLTWVPFNPQTLGVYDALVSIEFTTGLLTLTSLGTFDINDQTLTFSPLTLDPYGSVDTRHSTSLVGVPLTPDPYGIANIKGTTRAEWTNFTPSVFGTIDVDGSTNLKWAVVDPGPVGDTNTDDEVPLLHYLTWLSNTVAATQWNNAANAHGRSDGTVADSNTNTAQSRLTLDTFAFRTTASSNLAIHTELTQIAVSEQTNTAVGVGENYDYDVITHNGTRAIFSNQTAAHDFADANFGSQRMVTDSTAVLDDVDGTNTKPTLAQLSDWDHRFTHDKAMAGNGGDFSVDAVCTSIWLRHAGASAPTITLARRGSLTGWTQNNITQTNGRFQITGLSDGEAVKASPDAGAFVAIWRTGAARPAVGTTDATQFRWWMPNSGDQTSDPRYQLVYRVASTAANDRLVFQKVDSAGTATDISTATPSGGWFAQTDAGRVGDWLIIEWIDSQLNVYWLKGPQAADRVRLFNAVAGDAATVTQTSGFFGQFVTATAGANAWNDDLMYIT